MIFGSLTAPQSVFRGKSFDADSGYLWDAGIANFERQKLGSPVMRWLCRLGGVLDPDGQMPRDMRPTFEKPRLKAAIETMDEFEPPAH